MVYADYASFEYAPKSLYCVGVETSLVDVLTETMGNFFVDKFLVYIIISTLTIGYDAYAYVGKFIYD